MPLLSSAWQAFLQLGSLAGLASLAWQGWRTWQESRDRLALVTSGTGEHSLELIVSFRPKSHHAGLEARIRVLEPSGAKVAFVEPDPNESIDAAIRSAIKEVQADKASTGRLLHWAGDDDGLYKARAYLATEASADGCLRAKVRVEVWTTGYRRRLLAVTRRVSAID